MRDDRTLRLTLKNASRRGSHRKDSPGGIYGASGLLGDGIALGVHVVVDHAFGLHWQKGSNADVKSDVGMRYSGKNFRSEMKACSGGRHRAGRFGKHRLVANLILLVRLPAQVRRNWNAAEVLEVGFPVEFHYARSVLERFHDTRLYSRDGEGESWTHLPTRFRQAEPFSRA